MYVLDDIMLDVHEHHCNIAYGKYNRLKPIIDVIDHVD